MPHFEEIYEQYRHMVFNLCLHYLQQQQEAEEAAQDIFVKIHGAMAGFSGKSSWKTWVYRIAVNHCLDRLRARKRRSRLFFFWDKQEETAVAFDHPGVLMEDREALERLFRHINGLPENQKTALILRYVDDLTPPEVADVMGLSLKAVESLLQRAKQGLEKKLRDSEGN